MLLIHGSPRHPARCGTRKATPWSSSARPNTVSKPTPAAATLHPACPQARARAARRPPGGRRPHLLRPGSEAGLRGFRHDRKRLAKPDAQPTVLPRTSSRNPTRTVMKRHSSPLTRATPNSLSTVPFSGPPRAGPWGPDAASRRSSGLQPSRPGGRGSGSNELALLTARLEADRDRAPGRVVRGGSPWGRTRPR